MNKRLLSIIFFFLIMIGYSMSIKQKQTMSPSSLIVALAQGTIPTIEEARRLFLEDCKNNISENGFIPCKKNGALRILTFNVRMWTNIGDKPNFLDTLEVIKTLDPDIVILQEVRDWEKTYAHFMKMGYDPHAVACITKDPNFGPAIFAKNCIVKNSFAAIFKHQSASNRELSFVRLDISYHNNDLAVYGTHLEVDDYLTKESNEKVRTAQIREILQDTKKLSHANSIIAGDFNTVRKSDYNYMINNQHAWDLITKLYTIFISQKPELEALGLLTNNNYRSSFELLQWKNPTFTNWLSRALDFIFFAPSKITILGSYVYYTASSDHLPVLTDFEI